MSKKIQGIIIGFLCAFLFTTCIASASQATKSLNVLYRDIKLKINDNIITPRDANGNVVEPFAFEGTTYLPVRAVGEALGLSVGWDNDTSTVIMSGKPQKQLSVAINFINRATKNNEFFVDFEDENSFICFRPSSSLGTADFSGNYDFKNSFSYPLKGMTSKMEGQLIPPVCSDSRKGSFCIRFIDESGNVLFESDTIFSSQDKTPIDFSVDTQDVQTITVEFEGKTTAAFPYKCTCKIRNLTISTTDY